MFLDGFQLEAYGTSREGEAAATGHEKIRTGMTSPYLEPAEYELWLRGLLPDSKSAGDCVRLRITMELIFVLLRCSSLQHPTSPQPWL
jgi:hypothetical protein